MSEDIAAPEVNMINNKLLRTNIIVSIIIIIGFILTALLSNKVNYRMSLENMEQVSSLTAEGIYYQLTSRLTKPVNISLTMSNDSFLKSHLYKEADNLNNEEYTEEIKDYLNTYKKKYGFDSVFLVSDETKRYYNFNGIDRVLTEDNSENKWYFRLLNSEEAYHMEIDNDEVRGADNEITVFVNCKVEGDKGEVLGVVGVGIRIDYLKQLLEAYENEFEVSAYLINDDGKIEISTTYTGYENIDWFKQYEKESVRNEIINWRKGSENQEIWIYSNDRSTEKSFVVTRYIPELSWHLIVEKNTEKIISDIKIQIIETCLILFIVVLMVIFIITSVLNNFNKQIMKLMNDKQEIFKKATEELYDNIYELNITKNKYEGRRTEEYFDSLGAKGLSFSEGLYVISRKQIKEEYREGYLTTFMPENVIKEYERGNNHLQYEFEIALDGENYNWMRIDAYIFLSKEDGCIHMFTYRKNIDEEKKKELQAVIDEMTGFYSKKATERLIEKELCAKTNQCYAFYIFDIDNFKQANDQFGHVFGDFCIKEFTRIISEHFDKESILGRIGGDEFAAFTLAQNKEWALDKAGEVSRALDITVSDKGAVWSMSASIGIAIAKSGDDFDTLYHNADAALYQTKHSGKNGFTVYGSSI